MHALASSAFQYPQTKELRIHLSILPSTRLNLVPLGRSPFLQPRRHLISLSPSPAYWNARHPGSWYDLGRARRRGKGPEATAEQPQRDARRCRRESSEGGDPNLPRTIVSSSSSSLACSLWIRNSKVPVLLITSGGWGGHSGRGQETGGHQSRVMEDIHVDVIW